MALIFFNDFFMTIKNSKSKSLFSVEIRGVSKTFNNVNALKNISLKIHKGEFFSLLGPSGCGKTTLLRMIGGFENPSSGSVLIDGIDMLNIAPYERNTNMIFQHLALFPHLNVWDNIAFGLKMKNLSTKIIGEKVLNSLELTRMSGFEKRKINELSGGQKQRVAMARAVVNDPTVLLLDEPLGALDLQLRIQMQTELRRLHKSLANTFVFVTHDQGEAMAMSDRIAVMHNGEILQVGTPHEIYEMPKTKFVANFVGHSNLFDGFVTKNHKKNQYVVNIEDFEFIVNYSNSVKNNQKVSIALRYESIYINNKPNKNLEQSCEVKVLEKIYMGSFIRLITISTCGIKFTVDLKKDDPLIEIKETDNLNLCWKIESLKILKS